MKTHMVIIKRNRFGGFTNSSLCGRLNKSSRDSLNVTDLSHLVTCGFCKKKLARQQSK